MHRGRRTGNAPLAAERRVEAVSLDHLGQARGDAETTQNPTFAAYAAPRQQPRTVMKPADFCFCFCFLSHLGGKCRAASPSQLQPFRT